jgi:chorismate mutase
MATRGIRGAIAAAADEPQAILRATQELLREIMSQNDGLRVQDIASAFFTLTEDLCSAYPATAARQMGWDEVPMLCAREIPLPGGLPRIIRVLIHWNTDVPQSQIRHIYLHEAAKLRPDLAAARQQA